MTIKEIKKEIKTCLEDNKKEHTITKPTEHNKSYIQR